MEKITYAQYLQDNIGSLMMSECLEVIRQAERGELSDLDVEEELTPVVGNVLTELFNKDRETFEYLLEKIKVAAEQRERLEKEEHLKFEMYPMGEALDLLPKFGKILNYIRDGYVIHDHWLDADGVLIVVLDEPQAE
ncbi:hypothetical protein PAEVO_51680 [Paenibacillus sp. GM2FR]|uniref:hypothetical protein n=1 Tax=Paenibacillus sp. GM2FR TaxID=2059268 RepID=UPI000C280229|nr:hypothetical protein [Paenibacillus sp. GM2FR]PJN50124.1 hypothetical protein PAEVO_51680 [Paenibacillus sp. GM2FR]